MPPTVKALMQFFKTGDLGDADFAIFEYSFLLIAILITDDIFCRVLKFIHPLINMTLTLHGKKCIINKNDWKVD